VETANLHQLTLARSQLYCTGENGSLSYYCYGSRVPATPARHSHARRKPPLRPTYMAIGLATDATDAVESRVPYKSDRNYCSVT